MIRLTRLLPAAALLAAGFAAPAMARDLTVVSWGGAYQDAQRALYFEPFKAAGNPMHDESWDGGIGVLRAKVEGGDSSWDVVQVESEELALGCEEGLFEPLKWDAIGGRDAYLPEAVNDCGVGAIVYNFILAYDGAKFPNGGPQSWADFWDVKKFPGKRAMRQGPKTNLEIALMADGVAPADVYKVLATPEGVDRAFRKLDELKPNIVWWTAGAQPPQMLAAGEAAMTTAYNGRISAANDADKKDFKIVWNGSLFTIDSWVILKGSPNVDAATKFLAYMGKPENQAKLPTKITYGVTNKAATPLIPAQYLPGLPTNPANMSQAIELNAEFWLENIDSLTERFNTWAAK
ncbi:ABC transporter substrate-binding protein [Inquilinus limosus]|uniref:Spermidine/putrescine ABC transporter substrate-binding protein n=1 Tax=Inquilinus limosus TaxID=171674 RepID=A0A211ZSZ7_9PROT|nr:ABC transporter substrate-binding protein [Inquilinus limosus]OWJ68349.1 spermidine/putrescine ABC transporter substrate-binding protein [Inquilinus limosus]